MNLQPVRWVCHRCGSGVIAATGWVSMCARCDGPCHGHPLCSACLAAARSAALLTRFSLAAPGTPQDRTW